MRNPYSSLQHSLKIFSSITRGLISIVCRVVFRDFHTGWNRVAVMFNQLCTTIDNSVSVTDTACSTCRSRGDISVNSVIVLIINRFVNATDSGRCTSTSLMEALLFLVSFVYATTRF